MLILAIVLAALPFIVSIFIGIIISINVNIIIGIIIAILSWFIVTFITQIILEFIYPCPSYDFDDLLEEVKRMERSPCPRGCTNCQACGNSQEAQAAYYKILKEAGLNIDKARELAEQNNTDICNKQQHKVNHYRTKN